MKHTPIPWGTRKANYIGRPSLYIDPINERNRNDSICVAVMRPHFPGEMEANAAFIVKAVNSHDALVEALKDMTALATARGVQDQFPMAVKWAKDALAAVE